MHNVLGIHLAERLYRKDPRSVDIVLGRKVINYPRLWVQSYANDFVEGR